MRIHSLSFISIYLSEKIITTCGPPKIRASSWVTGTNPNSLVALTGPHSPLAQSGRGTMTVCKSSQTILNLHTLLNFIGSPVRYSWGVTALAKMSRSMAPLQGAWTRKATTLFTTDWKIIMMVLFYFRSREELSLPTLDSHKPLYKFWTPFVLIILS